MRRRRPTWLRIAIAVAFVTLLYLPFADHKWWLFDVQAYDPVTGADPVFVSAPVADVTAAVAVHIWRICVALPEAVFGALAAIGVFALLGRPIVQATLCRRCGRVLKGLREPVCPSCGEHL